MPEVMSKGGVRITILHAIDSHSTANVVHVHASEYLWMNLKVESDLEGVEVVLATMQLKAKLIVMDREGIVDMEKLRRIICPRSDSIGGGNFLLEKGEGERSEEGMQLWSSMPCVVAAGFTPTAGQAELFEWIFRMPSQMPPSIDGHFLTVEYWVEAKVELKYKEIDRVMKVSQKIIVHSSASTDPIQSGSETAKIDFASLKQISHSTPYTRSLKDNSPSVWKRLLQEGILPQGIKDFRSHPLHPLNDSFIKGEDEEEHHGSMASFFKSIALSSTSRQYSLKSNERVVAEIKISRTCLRLGEELTCVFTFPSTSTVFQLSIELCGLEVLDRSVSMSDVTAEGLINSKIYRRKEIACWMQRQVSTSFSIPSIAMCTLESDIISHSWQLQVVFVCAKGSNAEEDSTTDQKDFLSLEPTPMTSSKSILTCSFPLTIVPCMAISQMCT